MKPNKKEEGTVKQSVKAAFALLSVLAISLSGCGVGSEDGGGLVATNAVVDKGVIDSFGSIFVNGVEYNTAGAIVHLRDDGIDPKLGQNETDVKGFLEKGMVVTVKGFKDDTGKKGIAQEVEFRNTLKAKIDDNGIDLVNNTITVMGQKISVDDPAKLAGLVAGDVVEISGLPDDKGQIKATHLKKKDNVAEFEAKGFVKLIPGSTTSFTLLLSPNATSGITVNQAAGVPLPAADSFIEVKTLTTKGGEIEVTKAPEVETELHHDPVANEKLSIEGFPASGTVIDFVLNGQHVQTTPATVFVGGIAANFALARKLEAQGTVVSGVLMAEKITFKVVNGGLSKGVVEKFGSIFVNGVEFKTQGATLHLRDDKTNPDRVLQTEADIATLLKPGMVVTVKGGFNNDGTTGIAQEIEFRNTLEGAIDDKGVDFVTVLGQKIAVDDPAKLVGLAVGDKVGISGLPDVRGQIRATHIEKKADLAEFEAKGFISNLSGTTFTLLLDKNATTGITVNLGGVVIPAGAVNGSFVQVSTTGAAAGAVTATKVELEDVLEAAENEKKQHEGFITSLTTPDDFVVNGQQVHLAATTMFIGGIKADLVVGMKVETEGTVVGGIINATKVMFNDNVKIDAILGGAPNVATTTTQANLTLLGKKVIITSATDLKGLAGTTLALTAVAAGQEVQIRGFMATNGDIVATRVDLKDTAPDPLKFRPFLRGPVTAKDAVAGTLTIAGITVKAGTNFVDNSASHTAVTDFFTKVTPNSTAVKVTWNPGDATSVAVREAELET